MNEPWIIYGLVAFAAVLAIESLYWLMFSLRGENKAINRRLALSRSSQGGAAEVLDILRNERGVSDLSNPSLSRLNDFLVQTGLRLSKTSLALWVVGLAVAIAAILYALAINPLIAGAVGLLLAVALVALFLARARRKRIERFAQQLPDALDVIVRGLRVGHPFSSAIDLVAREMQDPIGSELGITADEMTFGQSIVTAVSNLYRRVGQEDLMFLAIAVGVQSQTGGNLADVLARLATLMRERITMALKIRALSAEGRLSGWFLTVMPFLLYGIVQFLSPNYYKEFFESAAFIPAVIYIVAALVISNVAIYRMVNFKV